MDPSYNQAPPQVPQQPQMQPISSGAGDIVLSQPEKKSRKGLIVLIVILMVVAIAGIVTAVVLTNTRQETEKNGMVDLKEPYNRFVNYVVFGKDSAEDVSMADVEDATWYYTSVDDETKTEYLEKTEVLYNSLKASYDVYRAGVENTEEDSAVDMEVLKTLLIDCEEVDDFDYAEILSSYVTNGEEMTKKMITEEYRINEEMNDDIKGFLEAEQSLAETYLSMIVAENNAGCIVDGVEVEGCYTMSEEEKTALADSVENVFAVLLSFNTRSLNTINSIHEIIYGVQEEVDTEEVTDE